MESKSQKTREILTQFKEYLKSDKALNHLKAMEKEKVDVKDLMEKLSKMDIRSRARLHAHNHVYNLMNLRSLC